MLDVFGDFRVGEVALEVGVGEGVVVGEGDLIDVVAVNELFLGGALLVAEASAHGSIILKFIQATSHRIYQSHRILRLLNRTSGLILKSITGRYSVASSVRSFL